MAENDLSLAQAPLHCSKCGKRLCLRQQVLNLVLANTDEMFCLICLDVSEEKEPKEVLLASKEYIKTRDCFNKEWLKYTNKSDCPDPHGCFPTDCFAD